jgi:hypothetical protein
MQLWPYKAAAHEQDNSSDSELNKEISMKIYCEHGCLTPRIKRLGHGGSVELSCISPEIGI